MSQDKDQNIVAPKKATPLSFHDFLNQSTNLLTVFGIFNALSVFALSADQKISYVLLSPIFLVLSLIVWWYIIRFAIHSSDESKIYEVFIILLGLAQLGLVLFVIVLYAPVVFLLVLIGVLVGYILLFNWLLIKLFGRYVIPWTRKHNGKHEVLRRQRMIFFSLLLAMIPAFFATRYTYRLALPPILKAMPESVWELPWKQDIRDSLKPPATK